MNNTINTTSKRTFSSFLNAAAESPSFPFLCLAAAVLIATICSLLIYPEVAGSLNNKVTTDGYDALGLGLYQYGTLSFYPDPEPTILRAPLYPLALSTLFVLGTHLLPFSVQIAQALLHGLTCLMVFDIAKKVAGPRRAPLVAMLCAIHPYLLWYTGRMVIETTSVFVFTLIIFCLLRYLSQPSGLRAVVTGIAVGTGILCKSTYLPFAFLIPLLLYLAHRHQTRLLHAVLVLVCSLAVTAPWIVRNHTVSGQWGIVQALTGYNFYVGDRFVERYSSSPLSYAAIIARTDFAKMDEGLPDTIRTATGARREALQDEWLLSRSLERYKEEPVFLLKKIVANAAMFWTLGSTPAVSVMTMMLQLPLLLFFVRSAIRRIRSDGFFSPACLPLILLVVYFGIHLPVYALARFSVVFVPTMIAYAFAPLSHEASASAAA
jgi:4-amino-4-deoxy-L-arabinose transferase-like glycosyltransferase